MVFESVVADLLNRFLGDYVENLDHSQLKIGIWGGDVVLQDLVLKQTALDDLNLPVKTVFGTLGKLVLKIPWKQLYSAPVEASVDTLFLLVVPNQEVKYDPIKEEKWEQDAKQAELLKIEEAKKLEKQKDKPKADDTFLEKLATNIIKNVQVKIGNIHIRYEDKITKPLQPFSLGITLHNLSVHTTDENWKACVVQEAVTMIHKILTLEGLALYWNPNSVFYLGRPPAEMISLFKEGICSKSVTPEDYKYMLGPINSSAKLRLNPKPENDGSNYTIPKVHLSLEMETLSLAISRFQFHDLIDLLESFSRMSRAAPFRKYRPFVSSYRGHYKEWWKFAYTCVLEDTVRRRRRNWDWEHILKHRQLCHTYADSYQSKLTARKISPELQTKLDNCEKFLDVLNIVLIRQKIEVEVERQERKEKELQKQKSAGGWFSSWFGGSAQVKEEETLTAAAIAKKFEEAMTPEEKAKLYRAIDYQENMKPTLYPKTFVENYVTFMLNGLLLEVRDDSLLVPRVLSIEFKGVASKLEQRPSADALKVTAQIEELTVFGLKQKDEIPHIVSSKEQRSKALLDVLFETKPLDEKCDQRIHLFSKPLKVIYDAETVNKVIDIFTAPKDVDLSEIQAAAGSKLADFKEMSATGLQYAIEQQNVLELKVDLQAPYVILPYSGFYTGNENALVVNLGSFKMTSVPRDRTTSPNVRALHSQGTAEEEILKTLMSHSYDQFKINLEQVQVLIALEGEDWMSALTKSEGTPMHLLLPTNLSVQLHKCLITDDPRLPKVKVIGHLPNVEVNITDTRLLQLIGLLSSVPWPGHDECAPQPLQDTTSKSSSVSTLNKFMDMTSDMNRKMRPSTAVLPQLPKKTEELVQFTELDVNFQMGELKVSIYQASEDEKLLDFHMLCLEVEMVQRTFDMKVILRIGGINLVHYDPLAPVCLLDTPLTSGSTEYLLSIVFIDVNKKSPEFHTKYGSVLKMLDVHFTTLNVLLHQESLLALLEVYNTFMPQLEKAKAKPQERVVVQPTQTKVPLSVIRENEITVQFVETISKPKRKPRKAVEEIDLKLVANLDNFKLEIGTRRTKIASLLVKGAIAGITMKKTHTVLNAKLKDLVVHDPSPDTIHSNILSIMGEEVMSAQVVMYNLEDEDDKGDLAEKVNTSVQASMACLRVVFLNMFVTRTLNFLNSFQEAQQAIMNAAAGAAEAAKQNMQEAYVKAVKLSLDIKLQAPLIVVPVNSMSLDVLLLDFGNLTMSNSFRTLNTRNVKGYPAVMDEAHLDLTNLKLCRARLADDAIHVIKEIAILQPITFQFVIMRNLSVGWYKEVPDLDLSGRLDTINITLSQEDFRMVMEVLNGNLQEQPPTQQEIPVSGSMKPEITWSDTGKPKDRPESLEGIQSAVVVTELDTEAETQSKEKESPTEQQSQEAPVYTKVKFTLTMESLVIDLFTGGSKELKSDVPSVHLPEDGLGRFSLHILSIKGRILSDTSLITSILLVDCLLDDTRTSSDSKIKRLMERKVDKVGSDPSGSGDVPFRSMIDMTFQHRSYSNANDMFVDIRIFGFTLTLCLSYLMKISDFFTSAMASPAPPAEPAIADLGSHSSTVSAKSSKSSRVTAPRSKTTVNNAESKQAPTTTMTVNIRVEKPDIILVEDMDDLDTNSIILNNEITFKFRMTENRQVMNGVIKDLQLYSCCFNPEKRKDSMTQILFPCSISLAGSTPEGQGLHLDVCISDIRLRVSPATIGLLSSVQSQLAVGGDETEGEDKEMDYSSIWNTNSFQDTDYWFLKTEMGEDAVLGEQTNVEKPPPTGEVCMLSAPSVVITMEAGVGSQTLPMILLELGFHGTVVDWSTQMNFNSSLTVQMSYYNSHLALWEPLIEPVEQVKDGKVIHGAWELCAEVHMNPQEPIASPLSQVATDIEEVPYVPPAMSIEVKSKDNLELTVTKTCLDVLSNLGKAFQTAVKEGPKKHIAVSPYRVQNDTGLVITLLLDKGPFKVHDDKDGEIVKQVVLQSGAKVGLGLQQPEDIGSISVTSPTSEKGKVTEKFLTIKINEMKDAELELPVVRADKRYFSLNHRGDSKDNWGLVSDITVRDGGTIITLRSIVQILNDFSEPIDVYYMTRRGNEVECIGTVESGQHINLPLYAIYTPTNELFFSVKGYTVSVTPFIWKDLQNQLTASKLLQCNPKNNDKEPFFMKIDGEMEQVYYEKSTKHTMLSTCYNIHLRPAVILKNFLPLELICCVQGIPTQKIIKAGESMQMPTAEPGNTTIVLRIPDYLEKEWSCKHEIQLNAPDFSVWTFESYDSVQKLTMDLGMHTMTKSGSVVMSLYCPFWMLNKTGLMLSYRQFDDSTNVIYHPEDYKGPILFSFKPKSFFGKKKASIKVEDGEWSEKFSLDVAGSSGVINCITGDTTYQIGIQIQLTNSTLTKQVLFTPYYVLVNNAPFIIEVQESDRGADPWVKAGPKDCIPFWPRSKEQGKQLRARIQGTTEMSASFAYTTVHTTLLKLHNKYGGLNVDVQMTEGAVYVTFSSYEPGMAPALILNHTNYSVSLSEKNCSTIRILKPYESLLYAWEVPTGSRIISWKDKKSKEISDELRKDGIGEFTPETSEQQMWWVSFLDGMQRVLLFTPDMSIARDAQSAGELERISQEITVSIHGLGFSLVNNVQHVELMYIGIASSGIIWETCKANKQRFKPLSVKDCQAIEEAYVQYNIAVEMGREVSPKVSIENKYEVDFENGLMFKPAKRRLRRTFQTGLWLQMKTAPHQMQLHAKINRLQIDNQMHDCIFPVVLAPVPPPKSVAADSALKPFAELSIVQRIMPHSTVQQYKYFKVLIQEFHVKVDMGFINALLEMFEAGEVSESEEMRLFEEDKGLVDKPLLSHVTLVSSQEQKNFYDLLHFSPLKIHLSFSLSGGTSPKAPGQGQEAPRFLNVLMQSLGVTLTDMQDVIFKLAYFERQYTFLTQQQLISEATMHYVGQSVKQLYVLVLGLDVIGNPYGLVLGLTQGVEDLFYEPFQGAIQGPGEFAEGLVLGVRSLFGHTVGGAAGAVSRITGAMGKGIAALTFDKDYQRKRREAMNQRPANVQMGLAQSGKGLVMGVVDGVSGVILKPISGAKQEGVEGFFKGVGKGVMGLVTRPTAGVIDFASGSLDVVKRAAEMSDEVTRLRSPRFLQQDGLVRPYVRMEAEGNKLLQELDKGKYATTDVYEFHMTIGPTNKDVLMLTDKRVMYIVHNDIFGGWQVDWDYTWESLNAPPRVVEKGIFISTGEHKKKVLGLFGHGESGKVILIHGQEKKEWLTNKMIELMKT